MHLGNKLLILVFLITSALVAQPSVRLSGPTQARIGLSSGLNAKIESKGISGIVRLEIELPAGWTFEPYPGELASISQSGNRLRVIWMEFPQREVINVALMLKIPSDAPVGHVDLKGHLDYFIQGKKQRISIPAFDLRVVKYFTRF